MSPLQRHSTGWRRRVKAAFTERLALKAASVFLAVVLWFAVAAREPGEIWASVRFAPQVDSTLVLRDTALIQALVVGSASEIRKLSNTPLVIRRSITSDAPDTLVLALRTSDVEVPEGVEVIVRDIRPRNLTLRFESMVSRLVPVRSAMIVMAPAGTRGVSVQLDPANVTVSGPRRAVAKVNSVATVSDSIAVDTLTHLVDLDTAGLGVSVRPPQVKALFRRARP